MASSMQDELFRRSKAKGAKYSPFAKREVADFARVYHQLRWDVEFVGVMVSGCAEGCGWWWVGRGVVGCGCPVAPWCMSQQLVGWACLPALLLLTGATSYQSWTEAVPQAVTCLGAAAPQYLAAAGGAGVLAQAVPHCLQQTRPFLPPCLLTLPTGATCSSLPMPAFSAAPFPFSPPLLLP